MCPDCHSRGNGELDKSCRGATRRGLWQAPWEESGWKTGRHTAISQFLQGTQNKKVDFRSTKSTSGTMSQGFQDVHRSSLEETSTGTPCQTTQRLGGTTLARCSRTVERTLVKAQEPSPRGPRGLYRQARAGKETLGEDTTKGPITFCFQWIWNLHLLTVDFRSSRNLRELHLLRSITRP